MIVRYKQLTACENAQAPQTPAGSGNNNPAPAPTPAKSKKQKAEERAESMTAGITDPRQKKKAEKLAAAAIGGLKVNKVKFA